MYIFIVGIFFVAAKAVNARLHHLFDTSEYKEEIIDRATYGDSLFTGPVSGDNADETGIEMQDLGSRVTAVNITPPRKSPAASLTDLTREAGAESTVLAESVRDNVAAGGEGCVRHHQTLVDLHTVPSSITDGTSWQYIHQEDGDRHGRRKRKRHAHRKQTEPETNPDDIVITMNNREEDTEIKQPKDRNRRAKRSRRKNEEKGTGEENIQKSESVAVEHKSSLSRSCSPLLDPTDSKEKYEETSGVREQKENSCRGCQGSKISKKDDCRCIFRGGSDMDMETYQAELEDAIKALLFFPTSDSKTEEVPARQRHDSGPYVNMGQLCLHFY